MAKGVFDKMYASSRTAGEIVAAEGLAQIDDESQIVALIAEVLAAHPGPVADVRGGKASAFGFLVGKVMKAASGKANPKRVNELLKKTLGSGHET
jgi:aspartyl-tRNA(Asn)/glutamyl-tRNA(Gln) amidotransferase subunit B